MLNPNNVPTAHTSTFRFNVFFVGGRGYTIAANDCKVLSSYSCRDLCGSEAQTNRATGRDSEQDAQIMENPTEAHGFTCASQVRRGTVVFADDAFTDAAKAEG